MVADESGHGNMSHTLRVEFAEGHPYITATCRDPASCPTVEDVPELCWFVHAIEEGGGDMLDMTMILDVVLSADGYDFEHPIKVKVVALRTEP